MKRAALLSLMLLAALARPAYGAGVNLSWTQCGGRDSDANQAFACNDESRSFTIVGSFVAPPGVSKLSATEADLDFISDAQELPDWWRLGDAACRDGWLTLATSSRAGASCAPLWTSETFTIPMQLQATGPGRARLRLGIARAEDRAGPVSSGREYTDFVLTVSAEGTGPGGCGGCDARMCIVLNTIVLCQPPDNGDVAITDMASRNYVTWQGGTQSCAGARRAETRTWGQVKSFYR